MNPEPCPIHLQYQIPRIHSDSFELCRHCLQITPFPHGIEFPEQLPPDLKLVHSRDIAPSIKALYFQDVSSRDRGSFNLIGSTLCPVGECLCDEIQVPCFRRTEFKAGEKTFGFCLLLLIPQSNSPCIDRLTQKNAPVMICS